MVDMVDRGENDMVDSKNAYQVLKNQTKTDQHKTIEDSNGRLLTESTDGLNIGRTCTASS